MIIGVLLGIVIGWIGWRMMVKHIPGSLVGSLLAGMVGGFLGSVFLGGTGMGHLWYILLCGVMVSVLLVAVVNLVIRQANSGQKR
ncbi:hypothetical protein [Saccharibacillus sacchari]|uniref:hypothetical protein n=1 Tax=Saccharibacillus sacchari TaxID=456493 RepID=UPI0004B961E9|nr:hypothetical protein [Saccharibacillus sacchari]